MKKRVFGAMALVAMMGLAASAEAISVPKIFGGKPKRVAPVQLKPIVDTPADWRTVDPNNVMVIDTTKGRVIVELYPEIAPAHVERLRKLTHEHFYDGLKFHRVIEGFMAQTGDPLGTGEGQSPYENVKGEFTFRRGADFDFVAAAQPVGSVSGFHKALPLQTQPDEVMAITKDGKVHAWPLFCPGVAAMARSDDPNSANSQFFLMRAAYPALEKRYTAFGKVLSGLDIVRRLKVGEPVVDPDKMTKVRLLADMDPSEAPKIQVMDVKGAAFKERISRIRNEKGADFSVCDLEVPVKIQ